MATRNNRGNSRPATSRPTARRAASSRPAASMPSRRSGTTGMASSSQAVGYESRRIGDINRSSVQPRQQRRGRESSYGARPRSKAASRIKIAAIVVLVLALVVAGAYGYCRVMRVFPLSNVSIQGADHLTDDDKAALAQISDDASLLDVDIATIRSNFLSDAWVKDVSVDIVLPDTLVVNVTERQVGAIVEMKSADSSSTTNWALSTDGVWLMPIPSRDSEAGQRTSSRIYDDVDSVVHIVNVPYSTNPQIGASCGDSNVNNAVEILSNMTTDLANQIKSVSATDAESTTLLLQNGVEIAFGSATDIRAKERVCLELLEQHEGEIAYINVRTVSHPTWRSL